MEKELINKLYEKIKKVNIATWAMMDLGDCDYKSVTIKNGKCIVTSIETGFAKNLLADDYVNNYLGPMAVASVKSTHYTESWVEGRTYSDINAIVKTDSSEFELDERLAKYITIVKVVASESVKPENKDKVYQIDSKYLSDIFIVTCLDSKENIDEYFKETFCNESILTAEEMINLDSSLKILFN